MALTSDDNQITDWNGSQKKKKKMKQKQHTPNLKTLSRSITNLIND